MFVAGFVIVVSHFVIYRCFVVIPRHETCSGNSGQEMSATCFLGKEMSLVHWSNLWFGCLETRDYFAEKKLVFAVAIVLFVCGCCVGVMLFVDEYNFIV